LIGKFQIFLARFQQPYRLRISNEHLMGRVTVSQFLIIVDDALRALAESRSPEQLVGLANTAETLRRYGQRARLGIAAQNKWAELRLRAERKLGQYLVGTPRRAIIAADESAPRLRRLASCDPGPLIQFKNE